MLPGAGVGFLPATPNDLLCSASDRHTLWRDVPPDPACNRRATILRGRTDEVPAHGCPLNLRQSHLEPGRNRYMVLRRRSPLPLVRADRLHLGPRSLRYLRSTIANVSPTVSGDGRPQR